MGCTHPGVVKEKGIPKEYKVIHLGGEGHPYAEDYGNTPGWKDLNTVFKNPRKKDPDGRREWHKIICANGDPKGLGPWKWDFFSVLDGVQELNKDWYSIK